MKKELTPSSNAYKQLYLGNGYFTSCNMPEDDYMKMSPYWKKYKAERLKLDNYQCVNCKTAINLQVHHIRYPCAWGLEDIEDLITLCDDCHKKIHNKEEKKHGTDIRFE